MMQGRERETMRQLTSDFNVENLQRDKKLWAYNQSKTSTMKNKN